MDKLTIISMISTIVMKLTKIHACTLIIETFIIVISWIGGANAILILRYENLWKGLSVFYYIIVESVSWAIVMPLLMILISYNIYKDNKKSIFAFSYICLFAAGLFLYSLFHHNFIFLNVTLILIKFS
ncbi:hypothetical protein MXB_4832 [Myxobolus squamalis]|nr:hypothetical protein MXB_4832 [Myxobolus squamalis]